MRIKDKNDVIKNIFEGNEIRSIWDSEKEDYYFSVVDVISALTNSENPRDYWYKLKTRMIDEEKSELSTRCRQLKMKAKDGKERITDTLDTRGIFRLIESVPSPKAEPFKIWLAKLGGDKIDEVFDPSKGVEQMIDFYLMKGYSMEWIKIRINAIIDRKMLTKEWNDHGVNNPKDYGVLTNIMYKEWANMPAKEYKLYKNIRKESLRDNMSDVELSLTNLSEIATRELIKKHNPDGLKENKVYAKMGGNTAKVARENLEKDLGESVITPNNSLSYEYSVENILLTNASETRENLDFQIQQKN